MAENDSESVEMQAQQIQLPPIFEHFLAQLQGDRKKLLRDKAFRDPEQLRTFIGQYLFDRLDEMTRLLAGMTLEAYSLAASNTNEMRRMYAFTVEELNQLGADLDAEVSLPGVSPEALDDFQEAFYALGTHLQQKYPEDEDTQGAYNRVAQTVSEMVGELMSGYDEDYDDDDDDRDDDDGDMEEVDEDDLTKSAEEEKKKAAAEKKATAAKKKKSAAKKKAAAKKTEQPESDDGKADSDGDGDNG